MISLSVVVGNEFSGDFPQGIFAKEDHLLQTILFDRPDKPFVVRRARGQLYGLNAGAQNTQKFRRVERVSIMD
jgi:hypothetical protein